MGVKFCLRLAKFFILLLLFFFVNSVLSDKVSAQSCTDWLPTVSSIPSCSNPLFQDDCTGSGATTGTQCCRNLRYDYCENQTINQPALRYQFRCCNNAPPPPTPVPTPSCVQTPGSFASYDGCISCGYDRVNYYNCNGSTFSVDYANPECSYLCPVPTLDCTNNISCGACNLSISGNYCSNNGIRSCTYIGDGTCNAVPAPSQTCNIDNCSTSSGYTCQNGTCTRENPTCTPDGSCNAPAPACETTTSGTDNCGNP